MWFKKSPPTEAWRRTGTINVLLISVCGLTLLGCLLGSTLTPPHRSILGARIIYDDSCSGAKDRNLIFHFLINVFSTGVLASSNFFMQVVSSPSRQEIDRAHRFLCALEIGVPSTKNIFFLSRFKTVAWILLFLSSVPIHLFFNSAVYETNYEGTNWQLTLATERFVKEPGGWYGPGASLSASGTGTPGSYLNDTSWDRGNGYGYPIPLSTYWDQSLVQNITKANTQAKNWTRLEPSECFAEYKFCKPRKQYNDVVVVVNATDGGWTRSQVYHFDPTSNLSSMWNSHIPPNKTNSLWFSAFCSPQMDPDGRENVCTGYGCAGALGDPTGNTWINTTALQGEDWTFMFRPSSITAPNVYGFNQSFNDFNVSYCLAEPSLDYSCKIGVSNTLLAIVILCVFSKVLICITVLWKLPHSTLVTPGDAIESFISKPDPKTAALGPIDITDSHRLEYSKRPPRSAIDSRYVYGPKARKWASRPRRLRSIIYRAVWIRTYGLLTIGLTLLLTGLIAIVTTNGGGVLKSSFGSSDSNLTTSLAGSSPTYLSALLVGNSAQVILSLCYFSYNAFFTRLQAESEWSSYSLSYKPLRVSYPSGGKQVSTYRLQLPFTWSIPLLGISVLLHWLLSNALFIFIIEGGFWVGDSGTDLGNDGLGVSDDASGALGFSPPAVLTLFIISTVLCLIPILLSLRKVPGTMVAGGTNSLVLSAACHCSVLARPRRSSSAQQEPSMLKALGSKSTSTSIAEGSVVSASDIADVGDQTITEDPFEDRESTTSTTSTPWATVQRRENQQPLEGYGEDLRRESATSRDLHDGEESLLTDMTTEEREEYELSLLRRLTLSRIRWGVLPVDPDLKKSLELEGEENVMHLGFGSREDNVKTPKDGDLYI